MSEHYFPCGHKIVLGHTCPVCVNGDLLHVVKGTERRLRLHSDAFKNAGDIAASDAFLEETCQLAAALADAKGETG